MKRGTDRSKEEMEVLDTDLDLAIKEAVSNTLSLAMRKVTYNLQLNSNSDGIKSTEEEMVDPNTEDNDMMARTTKPPRSQGKKTAGWTYPSNIIAT
jgi:hypothetical protein